jgi:hypothetical protein
LQVAKPSSPGVRERRDPLGEAPEEILLRVSQLVEEVPEISELDLNPIFALPPGAGCRVVDARIQVRHPG